MGWDWDDDDDDVDDALVIRHHGVKNVVNRKRVRQIVSVLGTGAEARNAGVGRQQQTTPSHQPERDAYYSPYRSNTEVHATPGPYEDPYRASYEDPTSPSPFAMPPARHYAVTPGGTRRVVWRDEYASVEDASLVPRTSLEEVREMSVDRSPTATYRPWDPHVRGDPSTPPPVKTSEGWGGKPWKAWGGRTPGGYSDRSSEWSDTPLSRRDASIISVVDEDEEAGHADAVQLRPGTPVAEPAPPPSTRGVHSMTRTRPVTPQVVTPPANNRALANHSHSSRPDPSRSPKLVNSLNAGASNDTTTNDDTDVIEMLEYAHVHTVTKIREMRRELNEKERTLAAADANLVGAEDDRARLASTHATTETRERGKVSALLARYEAEIGGLKEEVETLRSAAKPPRPTPAQTKGKETTRRPEPIASSVRSTPVPSPTKVTPAVSPSSPVASLVRTTKQATTATIEPERKATVGSVPLSSKNPALPSASLVREDRRRPSTVDATRPSGAPAYTVPASTPAPASPVALTRTRTMTRDVDSKPPVEFVPPPASPRPVPPPANVTFARSRPGGRAAPPVSTAPAIQREGAIKQEADTRETAPATPAIANMARSRGAGASDGAMTPKVGAIGTSRSPGAGGGRWGAVKGKVGRGPKSPGVADVAMRVVKDMARSRRPAKD